MDRKRIGIIGLGLMGTAITERLLEHGFQCFIWNRTKEKANPLIALHRQSDARFAKYGVTADQFVLLATLSRGNAITQRELARRMSSDASTVRAMLVLLEKQ